jgi:sialate O-acetylesterase
MRAFLQLMKSPRSHRIQWFLTAFTALVLISCSPPLSFAPPFSDHMVLQRQKPINIWGKGKPGEKIRVTLDDRTITSTTLPDGSWSVTFPALPAGGPYHLSASSSHTTSKISDLWIGDVWLCAGQSNMELALVHTTNGIPQLLSTTPDSPRLLHLEKPTRPSFLPPTWTTSTTSDAGTFSGLGWRFGNHLQKENNIPIGLIQATRGNTPIQPWMPHHGEIFQTMIAPLKGIRLKGVVFYQGESSVNHANTYQKNLTKLIQGWRENFNDPQLPFFIIQLPNFGPHNSRPVNSPWANLRAAQAATTASIPNTFLIPAIDLGLPENLHPPEKSRLARRLTDSVSSHVYRKGPAPQPPTLLSIDWKSPFPVLTFHHCPGGLVLSESPLTGFAIAGPDGTYQNATATLQGNRVTLHSPIKNPQSIRYAWADNPQIHLYNHQGLPALPFESHNPHH